MKSNVELFWDAATAKMGVHTDWNTLTRDMQYQVVHAINAIIQAAHHNAAVQAQKEAA